MENRRLVGPSQEWLLKPTYKESPEVDRLSKTRQYHQLRHQSFGVRHWRIPWRLPWIVQLQLNVMHAYASQCNALM